MRVNQLIIRKNFILLISAFLFCNFLFAQSLAERYQVQKAQQQQLEDGNTRAKNEQDLIINYRRRINEGLLGDIIDCGYAERYAFVGNYAIRANNSGSFYFGNELYGDYFVYRKENGIIRWKDFRPYEFHINKKVIYMERRVNGELVIRSESCKMLRKEAANSIFSP